MVRHRRPRLHGCERLHTHQRSQQGRHHPGGENIPVVEIESLLYKHPVVAQVAVVAYPDERLGERACAVIVTKAGKTIDFAGMSDFLKEHKVAVQYIPEKLIVRDALPATPSGKIQKFRLREMLRDGKL